MTAENDKGSHTKTLYGQGMRIIAPIAGEVVPVSEKTSFVNDTLITKVTILEYPNGQKEVITVSNCEHIRPSARLSLSNINLNYLLWYGFHSEEVVSFIAPEIQNDPSTLHGILDAVNTRWLHLWIPHVINSPVFNPNHGTYGAILIQESHPAEFQILASHPEFDTNAGDILQKALIKCDKGSGDCKALDIVLSHPRFDIKLHSLSRWKLDFVQSRMQAIAELAEDNSNQPIAADIIVAECKVFQDLKTHHINKKQCDLNQLPFQECIHHLQARYLPFETSCEYRLPDEVMDQALTYNAIAGNTAESLLVNTSLRSCVAQYNLPQDVLLQYTYCPSPELCNQVKLYLQEYAQDSLLHVMLGVAALGMLEHNKAGDSVEENVISIQREDGIVYGADGHYDPTTGNVRIRSYRLNAEILLHEITHKVMDLLYQNQGNTKDIASFKEQVIKPYLKTIADSFDVTTINFNQDIHYVASELDRKVQERKKTVAEITQVKMYANVKPSEKNINTYNEVLSKHTTVTCEHLKRYHQLQCLNKVAEETLHRLDGSKLGDGASNIMNKMWVDLTIYEEIDRVREFIAHFMPEFLSGFADSLIAQSFASWAKGPFYSDAKSYIEQSSNCSAIIGIEEALNIKCTGGPSIEI